MSGTRKSPPNVAGARHGGGREEEAHSEYVWYFMELLWLGLCSEAPDRATRKSIPRHGKA